jgi:hypothetical protein
MSRGPGKIQRAIEAVFAAEPDNGFLLSELCERVYRGVNRIEKKHRVAVARAVRGIPELTCSRRETLGGELVIYKPGNVMSYAMARLKSDKFGGYERHSDPRFRWREPCSEADFRAMLAPGGNHHKHVVKGGAWWRFAATEHARLIGDVATHERLEQETKAKLMDQLTEGLRAAFAGMPERAQRPQRPPIVGYRLCIANEDGTVEKRDFKSRRTANKVC